MNHNPPNPTVRRALPTEADLVAAITAAAYAKYIPILGRAPQPMTADYQQLIAEHSVWLLFVAEEAPAGVLILISEPATTLIYSVAVSPTQQKRGLGRQLLDWAEQQARAAGHTTIRLYTNALMVNNIALYKHLGYTETKRESYPHSTLVHMAKPVPQA